ncbi:hypothetical protein DPMN_140188 [Dreissena polymorpha]|uniref:Uncharacterized protein n=1 Tax=Dreissena polymorpha TaxID=45954 RepID=A0A9D4JK57_DREPO|nr:hypothetical protein DPMN_140188 [Dreissena polymorpha]
MLVAVSVELYTLRAKLETSYLDSVRPPDGLKLLCRAAFQATSKCPKQLTSRGCKRWPQ